MVQMMYMIVNWNGEEWKILHYSHDFDDLHYILPILRSRYPDLKIMADVRMVHLYDGMEKIKEVQERLKGVKK